MATLVRDRRRMAALLALLLLMLTLGLSARLLPAGPTRPEEAHRHFQISTLDLTGERLVVVLTGERMVPGDTVTGVLTIANPGRPALNYQMVHGTVATGDELAAALVLDIRTVGSSCDDFDGASLYHGPLAAASLGHAPGAPRLLPGTSAEILCFRAELPIQAGNEVQGTGTTVSFRFDVEWAAGAP